MATTMIASYASRTPNMRFQSRRKSHDEGKSELEGTPHADAPIPTALISAGARLRAFKTAHAAKP